MLLFPLSCGLFWTLCFVRLNSPENLGSHFTLMKYLTT